MQTQPGEADEEYSWGEDYLAFSLADHEYGIAHDTVIETRRYDPAALTAVAGAPQFVKGAWAVEGQMAPVVDLRAKYGIEGTPQEASSPAVAFLLVRGQPTGILVDHGFDLMILQPYQKISELPVTLPVPIDHVAGIGVVGQRTLLLLKPESLLSAEEVAQVTAAMAAAFETD